MVLGGVLDRFVVCVPSACLNETFSIPVLPPLTFENNVFTPQSSLALFRKTTPGDGIRQLPGVIWSRRCDLGFGGWTSTVRRERD
ncbi:hypothetical protein TB2_008517 [Malus domestica]